MPLSDARIAEIVEEVRAEQARMDARRVTELASGLRCTCCGVEMKPTGNSECERCRALGDF